MKYLIFSLALMLSAVSQAEYSRSFLDAHPLQIAEVNGIEIAYRTVGQGADKPKVVVIMGLGGSNVAWGDTLIRGLADAGYEVLMFDNRDTGASTRFDHWGQPTLWLQLIKHRLNLPVNAPYSLDDMAADAVGLMDALGYQDGHIIGTSMGGMIAQIVAAKYPQRTRSLISIMSTTGARHLPPPTSLAENRLRNLAEGEAQEDREAAIRARGFYPGSMPRHLMAVFKVGDRSAEVATIEADTLVIHGADDGLIPPAHGQHTAELIPSARYVIFDNMGHNLPSEIMPDLLANMTRHINRVESSAAGAGI